jgi:hypothetical protein
MYTRREACLIASIFATGAYGKSKAVDGSVGALTIPFVFASGRGSMLIRALINRRAAVLIVDTGSSHTIVRPSIAGLSSVELAAPRVGAGIIGDAVGREVTLEIGSYVSKRRIAVMDLSNALSAYEEKIDGLLGIDFFLGFSQAIISVKMRTISFVP